MLSLLRSLRASRASLCTAQARRQHLPALVRNMSITDPYADGKYENPDGSPVDITSKLTKGSFGYSRSYAENYDRVFGKKDNDEEGGESSAAKWMETAFSEKSPEVRSYFTA